MAKRAQGKFLCVLADDTIPQPGFLTNAMKDMAKFPDGWGLVAFSVGGLLAGHDFEGPEYDPEYSDMDTFNGKHHGVIRAVTQTVKDYQYENGIWWQERKA